MTETLTSTKYHNTLSLIMGEPQTGKTTKFADVIRATASQVLIDVFVGQQAEKEHLLTLLGSDFPEQAIRLLTIVDGNLVISRTEDANTAFIEEGFSGAELFSVRDVLFYIDYAKKFIDAGYRHVVLTASFGAHFSFDIANHPEIAACNIMIRKPDALYCNSVYRVATISEVEAVREVEGELVD